MSEMEEKCRKLAQKAPKLTKKELGQFNALFPSYIFRRRKTGEVWTTCCGRHEVLHQGHPVLLAGHSPEPKPEKPCFCWSSIPLRPPKPQVIPPPCACPFCGKVSPVKELGRTGKRDNLAAYRRAVVLRWYRGALWGVGYYLNKSYRQEDSLTQPPTVDVAAVYRFTPGRAEAAVTHNWWRPHWVEYAELTGPLPRKYKFPEPFKYCAEFGMAYDLVGAEEMDKSPFKWCGILRYNGLKGVDYMRYLALCTAYSRQAEMLLKAGLTEAVTDFCQRGTKNVRLFDWEETDPRKSFGLSKEELRDFLASRPDLHRLATYKALRRKGVKTTFWDLLEMGQNGTYAPAAALLPALRLSPARLTRYLQSELSKKTPYLSTLAQWWKDYIDAARVLGYDLTNPVVLLPRGLKEHHDRATQAALAVREAARAKKRPEHERKRLKTLTKQYTYTDGRWLIRPPLGAAEIVAEGKALRHCVGGYADRHVNGNTTILFLRDRQQPGKPLVTIQMQDKQIVQIHGWDDERSACKANPKRQDPRKLYADFLGPWLEWVAAGSRRDKKGRPVLPARRKEGAA